MFTAKEIDKLREALGALEQIRADISELHVNARDKFDGRSDKWRESDKGQEAETMLGFAEVAVDALDTATDGLSSIEGINQ